MTSPASPLPRVPWIHGDLEARLGAIGADETTCAFARALRDDGLAPFDLGPEAAALCERAAADVERYFQAPGVRRVQDAWRESPAVRALAGHPAMLSALEAAYGRRPFAFQTLNFRQGSEQNVHTDALHFHSDPPGFMCGVWIALEDVRPESGPLTYYPGSHKLPYPEALLAQGPLDEDAYTLRLRDELQAAGLAPAAAMPRKGQAVVWVANLAHGGSPIQDPTSTRRSLVVHYFFEDCAYYTPLTSRLHEGRKRLRLPMDVATGRCVWPRREGRPLAIRPQAVAHWAWRAMRRRALTM